MVPSASMSAPRCSGRGWRRHWPRSPPTLKLPSSGSSSARLDDLCARRLRHLRVALDGGRRLGLIDGCNNLLAAIRPRRPSGWLPERRYRVRGRQRSRGSGKRASLADFAGLEVEGHFCNHDPHLQLRRAWLPCRSRSAQRPRRDHRLRSDRGCGRRDQSAYRPRPGDRRAGAGLGGVFLDQLIYDADAQY